MGATDGKNGAADATDKPPAAEWLLVEIWRDIRSDVRERSKDTIITVFGIFEDVAITLVILGALQLLHIFVEALHVPDWVKVVVSKVHDYSYIIVIILVALGFVLRIAGHSYLGLWKSDRPKALSRGREERE